MEKEKQRKAFWILGSVAFLLISLINIYSYIIEKEPLSSELMVTLMGSVLGFSGGIVLFILAKNTNRVVDDLAERVVKVEDSIDAITQKDLIEAEKRVFIYNAMMDLKETEDAKKQIDLLGKRIKRISKRLIDEDGDFDHDTESFLVELCNDIAEIITTEYNYGLDTLDLVDFQKDLESKVEIAAKKSEAINNISKYHINILLNVEKYIKRLSGLQGRENGARRKLFYDETINFISLLVKNINKKVTEDEKI